MLEYTDCPPSLFQRPGFQFMRYFKHFVIESFNEKIILKILKKILNFKNFQVPDTGLGDITFLSKEIHNLMAHD